MHPKDIKKLEEYYARLPDWYWKHGLHDAKILSIVELELAPNWKENPQKRNCLEILLNSRFATCEKNVKRISLYNYRIAVMKMNATEPVALDAFQNNFWMGDSIEYLDDGRYLLELETIDTHGNPLFLGVEFEIPEVERK